MIGDSCDEIALRKKVTYVETRKVTFDDCNRYTEFYFISDSHISGNHGVFEENVSDKSCMI